MDGENGLLKEFLLKLGDCIYEDAAEAQQKYDECVTETQFCNAQMVRKIYLINIPCMINDIAPNLLGVDEEQFDFIAWYQHKRGLLTGDVSIKRSKDGFLIRLLKRALAWLSQ